MRDIIFFIDHDMTIVDSLQVFYISYNRALRKFGLKEISYDLFKKKFCQDSLEAPSQVDDKDFWEYFKKIYATKEYGILKSMPGAKEFLSSLKELGFPVIVVSGRGVEPEILESELKYLGLLQYVDEVKTLFRTEKGSFDKTSIFIDTKIEYNTSKCVVVGDYIEDMSSGKKANCFTIGVTGNCKSPEKLYRYGADIVFESLLELKENLRDVISGI